MAKKAPPLQIVIMMAFVGVLMLITWLSVSSPEATEESKARNTLNYFLEAVGRSPVERLGKELHPVVRRQYTVETLSRTLDDLHLNAPLQLSDWSQGEQTFEPRQWMWQLKTQGANAAPETLRAYIQYPEEVKISRRWHVRGLCRVDQELPAVTRELLQAIAAGESDLSTQQSIHWLSDKGQWVAAQQELKDAPQLQASPTAAAPEIEVRTQPRLQSEVRWPQNRLVLEWEAMPGEGLNCTYVLQNYRLGNRIDEAGDQAVTGAAS